MKNLKLKKTLVSGFILATITYSLAFAADTGSCGTNCTYHYDPTTQTLTYSADNNIANNNKVIIQKTNVLFGLSGAVKNVIINEGITGITTDGKQYAGLQDIGMTSGKLVIPDSFQIGQRSMLGLGFGTIEIGNNVNIGYYSFRFKNNANPKIIMSANSNVEFDENAFERGYTPASLNIFCKGNPDICVAKFGNSLNKIKGTVTADYYREYDDSGNIILEYNDNGYVKYDKDGKINQYDLTDNFLGAYIYDAGGNMIAQFDANGVATYKRTSYTPTEASSAVKKGNNNKITFTFK